MSNIIDAIPDVNLDRKPVSQEQLRREVDYVRAQQILGAMLNKGLISLSEFDKITAMNRESFSPMLAGIMPSNRCYNSHSELI
jgi:hypothetical protein